jgi:hypothetical protein
MLAMVAGLGALFALGLAAAPARDFFDLELLTAGQWFLTLLSAAAGLVLASAVWRLPQIQRLESQDLPAGGGGPAPIHRPVTGERPAVAGPSTAAGRRATAGDQ